MVNLSSEKLKKKEELEEELEELKKKINRSKNEAIRFGWKKVKEWTSENIEILENRIECEKIEVDLSEGDRVG